MPLKLLVISGLASITADRMRFKEILIPLQTFSSVQNMILSTSKNKNTPFLIAANFNSCRVTSIIKIQLTVVVIRDGWILSSQVTHEK